MNNGNIVITNQDDISKLFQQYLNSQINLGMANQNQGQNQPGKINPNMKIQDYVSNNMMMQNMDNPNMTYHQKEKESVGSPPTINYGEDFKISDAPQNMVVITGANGKEMMVDKNILEDLLDENQA